MLILGIDTSTKICTCSIFDSENGIIAETSLSVKKNHSNIVMPIIDNLFKISDLTINDIDKIAVAIGPGSFTGVRIALGIAKGLAMALNKPLIAVNELDILEAIASGNENEIIPLIDARKERVYYKYQNKYVDDYLINLISNFDKNKKYIFVGDGAINYKNILKDNPVKPSLAGLFIQAKNNQIVFKGANTEIELIRYANCEIESEGQVLIKPALLLEYIKLVEEDNINFEKKDGYLIVNNAEFSILDDNTYPELTEIIPIVIATENTVKFTMSLEKVKFLTNSSASMDTLFNSIKMIFKDNILELVSTDSFRLIYMKKELNNTINKDILVPGDSIAVIYKILKDLDEEFSLAASDDKLIVTWKDAYFTCKLLSLNFPDFRPLINNTNHDKRFEFNRDELNLALKKVISVTKNSNDSKNVATFNFKGNQLVISGVSSNAKINQKVNMIKTGEDLKLGMNCKYIKEFIDNVDKNIIIEATNSSSMLRFMEEGNENYIYLIMPVNIRV